MTIRSLQGSDAPLAVLFDLDNTLADRDRAFLDWARWFAQTRLGLTQEPAVDAAVRVMIDLDAEGRTTKDEFFSALKDRYSSLSGDTITLAAAFRPQLLAHLPPLSENAACLLDALDAALVPWGIVTNGSASQVHKVEKLGLANQAACIVISEKVGARKPDPAIFRAGAAGLGIAPSHILFVGDHPESDIVGAAQAGMRTAWLRRGREWPAAHVTTSPDVIVDALDELLWLAEGRGQGGTAQK